MCGIFGASGDLTDERLAAVERALAHRGPDEQHRWRDGEVGLAHARLRIIDLSPAAAQPMRGCHENVRLVFNGEIYNHRALRAELEARGHVFRSRCDAEAIVHGYEEWGDEVIRRLDGMFALGLWDGRTRRWLLARDRTGKKPLFYTLAPGQLRFASEVKALVAAGAVDEIDRSSLPMLLSWGYVPAPRTIHAGVSLLPPASLMTVDELGRASTSEYWQPGFDQPTLAVPFDDAKARVRALVEDAVERRLESDVPLGAFLSGGIDSTIVVGVMARRFGLRVRTFSIGFADDPRFDETHYARIAARAFATDHTEFSVEPSSIELIEKLVWLHDGPFADSSAIPTYTISRLMREHVTVALSGDGGDELFCGYLRFLAAEAAEKIPSPLRRALRRGAHLIPGALPHHSLGARARRFLEGADLSLADRIARWNSVFAFDLPSLLRPELALDLGAPLAWHRALFVGPTTPLGKTLQNNFCGYLAGDLQQKVDRCSAGCALEVRSPLLDTALIEFAARLPDSFRRRGTTTKHILREAFRDLIPPEIFGRGKMGFAVPLATWFRGALRDYVRDTLDARARILEYLDPSAVRAVVDQHLDGREDHSARLWTLLTLEVWLRSLAQAKGEIRREARVHG